MEQSRAEIIAWVGGQVLPHEPALRAWLRRTRLAEAQIDDAVQEAYCRLAALSDVRHIVDGRGYFFRTARNAAIEQMRRARIVPIDSVSRIEALGWLDEAPSPERAAVAQSELKLVARLLEGLPERCREIFVLRRVHALPQREVALRLGVSENVIEAQTARALRLILSAMKDNPGRSDESTSAHDPAAIRQRD